jgi:hypothetical protein
MHGIVGRLVAGIAGLAIGAALAQAAADQVADPARQTVPFRVFASDAKTLLYVGDYKIERSGGRIAATQRYLSSDGKLIKIDQSVYDAERRRPVSFYSANYLNGEIFRVEVKGETLSWQTEDAAGSVKDKATDDLPSGTYVWPNLVDLLAQEWDQIADGKTLLVDLYVVSRKMRVGLDLKADGKAEVSGVAGLRVNIVPNAWVFRQMAAPTWMTFSVAAPHHLLMYQGSGALRSADGKNIETVIVFDWSAPK